MKLEAHLRRKIFWCMLSLDKSWVRQQPHQCKLRTMQERSSTRIFNKQGFLHVKFQFTLQLLRISYHYFEEKIQYQTSKEKLKMVSIKQDCKLFASLYIACQARDGDLEEFLRHENHAILLQYHITGSWERETRPTFQMHRKSRWSKIRKSSSRDYNYRWCGSCSNDACWIRDNIWSVCTALCRKHFDRIEKWYFAPHWCRAWSIIIQIA